MYYVRIPYISYCSFCRSFEFVDLHFLDVIILLMFTTYLWKQQLWAGPVYTCQCPTGTSCSWAAPTGSSSPCCPPSNTAPPRWTTGSGSVRSRWSWRPGSRWRCRQVRELLRWNILGNINNHIFLSVNTYMKFMS